MEIQLTLNPRAKEKICQRGEKGTDSGRNNKLLGGGSTKPFNPRLASLTDELYKLLLLETCRLPKLTIFLAKKDFLTF